MRDAIRDDSKFKLLPDVVLAFLFVCVLVVELALLDGCRIAFVSEH